MESGKLRNMVAIESPMRSTGPSGEQVIEWKTVALAYCSILPIAAAESLLAQQVRSTVTHNIMMRYNSLITHECRLNWTSQKRIFHIAEIKCDPTFGRDMLIKASELASNK